MSLYPVAILAGGLATRLRPVTEKIPKALVEIEGEPFLAHQLRLLKSQGIERVVMCAWYRGDMIRDFAGDGRQFGLELEYSLDGPTPLGTGGAIKQALPLLGDRFFVLYGDSYLLCDYHGIQKHFSQSGKLGLMTVFKNFGKWDTSNVEFRAGQILAYDKKARTSRMEFIDYGLGVFSRTAFDPYAHASSFDIASIYQRLLSENQLAGFEVPERFYEIGSFEGLEELRNIFKSHRANLQG
jgi:N-acetyl-alpha-D-muramate 1-phosphate uridylyltransferase